MATDVSLDELERDALTELVNIGVSRAAASCARWSGEQVLLSVPAGDRQPRRGRRADLRARDRQSGHRAPELHRRLLRAGAAHLSRGEQPGTGARRHGRIVAATRRARWKTRRWPRPPTSSSTAVWRPSMSDVLVVDDNYECLRGEDVRDLLVACGATRYLATQATSSTLTSAEKLQLRRDVGLERATWEHQPEDFTIRGTWRGSPGD